MNQENPKTTELAEALPTLPSVAIQEAAADAEVFATASRASSTWRAYESDWRIFCSWCQTMDLAALPAAPATVAMFLAAEAKNGTAPSTLNRRLSAIRLMHLGARVVSPTDQSVARVIKKLAARAGLIASQYAGHSLRSGFLTSAAQARASIFKMQAQSRHKSLDVLSGYVRAQELFEDHAGEGLLTSTKSDDIS